MMENSVILAFILTALRLSTPLSFAALGGYCSERSGTINIALEGMMLAGAFAAAATAHLTHSAVYGIFAGVGAGLLMASLHAFLSINLGSNQIISGIAVNSIAAGLPPVISQAVFEMSGGTPLLETNERLQPIFELSPLLLGAFFCLIVLHTVHHKTRLGQYFRFAGEHPAALRSQGISVARVRWIGVLFSGVFCGLAGTYLSIDHGGGFARGMTSGRGFIALAALIIGRWTPLGAFLATLAFGAVEASQILLQGVTMPSGQTMPVQWIQMLPYVATILIIAVHFGKNRNQAPRALGVAH